MNILVLNGSPKGDYSITLQTSLYLKARYPQHTFDVLHVGQRIRALEKDFSEAEKKLCWADALIFSYPVYTFIAPSQLHRFIELMKAHSIPLSGKWATQISTSKHFYDVTAHRYVEENCLDLGLSYVRGLSADMDDLLSPKGRREAKAFFEHFLWSSQQGFCEKGPAPRPAFQPLTASVPENMPEEKSGDIVIIADLQEGDEALSSMIRRFQAVCPFKTRVVNLRQVTLKGGCLGCFHCACDGKCVYTDRFDEFLRQNLQTAQATIYAFTLKDHSMGSLFKMYDDRQFCNGHRTVTIGMPVGYLVNGEISREENLKTILEGRSQVGQNPLCGVASNEQNPDAEIDRLSASLEYALTHAFTRPQNFYGVGGMKIFRDLIYQMQGMMRADHRFYKSHGQYDFPQKNKGLILKMYLVGLLISNKTIKAKMGNKMNEGMIAPYRKVLQEAEKK